MHGTTDEPVASMYRLSRIGGIDRDRDLYASVIRVSGQGSILCVHLGKFIRNGTDDAFQFLCAGEAGAPIVPNDEIPLELDFERHVVLTPSTQDTELTTLVDSGDTDSLTESVLPISCAFHTDA
jgi:hypothetical protein